MRTVNTIWRHTHAKTKTDPTYQSVFDARFRFRLGALLKHAVLAADILIFSHKDKRRQSI